MTLLSFPAAVADATNSFEERATLSSLHLSWSLSLALDYSCCTGCLKSEWLTRRLHGDCVLRYARSQHLLPLNHIQKCLDCHQAIMVRMLGRTLMRILPG